MPPIPSSAVLAQSGVDVYNSYSILEIGDTGCRPAVTADSGPAPAIRHFLNLAVLWQNQIGRKLQ
jgi:hypothetical protein